MRYANVRDHILTGDLIAIRKRTGFLPVLTRWITGAPYTHTAVAVWVGSSGVDRLLVVESNAAGASLSPLSNYRGMDFDVFRCPIDRYKTHASMWRLLGNKIHYDIKDLVRIGLNRLFGVPLPEHDDDNLICSALSVTIYRKAGWRPAYLPSIPAPDDVVAAIGEKPLFEVRRLD